VQLYFVSLVEVVSLKLLPAYFHFLVIPWNLPNAKAKPMAIYMEVIHHAAAAAVYITFMSIYQKKYREE
jgi:hypothetical protein